MDLPKRTRKFRLLSSAIVCVCLLSLYYYRFDEILYHTYLFLRMGWCVILSNSVSAVYHFHLDKLYVI